MESLAVPSRRKQRGQEKAEACVVYPEDCVRDYKISNRKFSTTMLASSFSHMD